MSERNLKIGTWIILALPIVYFVQSCYSEKQDIRIDPVSQPKKWVYDITTIPLGERMYYVLIDGELNSDAGLETQIQIHPTRDSNYTSAGVMKLSKGKFSLVYNRDDSGPETFIYHPFKATKGWVRIQISPGQWPSRDSTRSDPEYLPAIHELK